MFCLFLTSSLTFVYALVVTTVSGFNNLTLLILDIISVIALLNPSLNPLVYCWRIRDLKFEALRFTRKFLFSCPAASRGSYSSRVASNITNLTLFNIRIRNQLMLFRLVLLKANLSERVRQCAFFFFVFRCRQSPGEF